MCEFISWYEKNGEVLYVNDAVLRTKVGQKYKRVQLSETMDPEQSPVYQVRDIVSAYYDDVKGHGAIEYIYYESYNKNPPAKGLHDREETCLDRSVVVTKIPEVIKKDILDGKFRRVGYNVHLLNLKGKEEFRAFKIQTVPAYKDLLEQLHKNYQLLCPTVWDDENYCWRALALNNSDIYKARMAEINDFKKLLFEIANEFHETILDYFWDLFEDKTNRSPIWRNMKI